MIVVASLGLISSQLLGGLQMTAYSDEQTRANQLADRILGLIEMDPDSLQQLFENQEADGDFGEQLPGWYWRVTVEPILDVEGLGQVTVEVLRAPGAEFGDPIDRAAPVRVLHLLRADPGRINLAEDFGISEEQLTILQETIPIAEFDPTNLDPLAIASLDPEMLMEVLPQILPLLGAFGGSGPGGAGGDVTPEQIMGMLGGGGGRPQIQNPFSPGGMAGGGQGGGRRGEGGPRGARDPGMDAIRELLGDSLPEGALNDSGGDGGRVGPDGRPIGIRELDSQRDARNRRGARDGGGRGGR